MDYTYDQNGLRVSKTVDGVKHTYLYASGKLLRETYGNVVLDFFYDQSGYPYAMTYKNGTAAAVTYYYITNLQGDVLTMITGTGTSVASYTYDPYGKPLTATGTMATINPLRYRGYYYDTETGFYYLQSRYYDPAICRFINADSYASTGQGVLGNNMFAYCNNNPVNALDPLGQDAIWLQDIDNAVAGILGHTGLLIQDSDGTWYYINWTNSYCCCRKVDPIEFDYASLESLMTIDGNRYDAAIYFEGDFSASIIYAQTLVKNYSPDAYKLVRNNCMQVAMDVLMQGEFEQNDTAYKAMLYKSQDSIIPNVAYSRMISFYNAEQAYNMAPNWAKWLCISPERAALIY